MPIKASLKSGLGRVLPRERLEQLTEYAIAEGEEAVSLESAELIVPTGRGWDDLIDRARVGLWGRTFAEAGTNDEILLLEFGVWRGDSMRAFTKLNSEPGSRFYGFDSFEGLPEAWRGTPAKQFDVGGHIPEIDDPRLLFVKGWFQQTVPPLLEQLEEQAKSRRVIVHFDADLFSSTLFLLFTLGAKIKRYHFIFDEFSGHETRALFNYIQATGAKANFLYRLNWKGAPQVVSGELIIP